jgi:hypothetical protein
MSEEVEQYPSSEGKRRWEVRRDKNEAACETRGKPVTDANDAVYIPFSEITPIVSKPYQRATGEMIWVTRCLEQGCAWVTEAQTAGEVCSAAARHEHKDCVAKTSIEEEISLTCTPEETRRTRGGERSKVTIC